jgi:hypothetical protein
VHDAFGEHAKISASIPRTVIGVLFGEGTEVAPGIQLSQYTFCQFMCIGFGALNVVSSSWGIDVRQ